MRWRLWLILTIQAALVVLLAVAVQTERIPLGIRGEWTWGRVAKNVPTPWDGRVLSASCVVAYAALVAVGLRALAARSSRWSEACWLGVLLAASIGVQVAVPMGAADEYDLTKWAYVNYLPGPTGYFKVAREQAAGDPWRFLARYPEWIRSQDSLHIGTHPPGLIVTQCILLRAMERSPALAEFLNEHVPPSVAMGFRQLEALDHRPIRRSERAGLYATALITLLACAGTVVPIYLLARAGLPPPTAWMAAALWPLMPAANLFQPGADTTYPLLSTTAWALAAWAARIQRGAPRFRPSAAALAAVSGIVMAFGLVFTLAFLPVGLIVAIVLGADRALGVRVRLGLIAAVGAGFLAIVSLGWLVTQADPFVVWSWNLYHHARFYDEYPRTYRLWLWVNGVEMAIAIGLPTIVWSLVGLLDPKRLPRTVWATLFVLVLVDLTGRNMGEVARLWMLYTPPFLIAAARGLDRLGAGPRTLGVTTALLGLQTLTLQAVIQVVYPV